MFLNGFIFEVTCAQLQSYQESQFIVATMFTGSSP